MFQLALFGCWNPLEAFQKPAACAVGVAADLFGIDAVGGADDAVQTLVDDRVDTALNLHALPQVIFHLFDPLVVQLLQLLEHGRHQHLQPIKKFKNYSNYLRHFHGNFHSIPAGFLEQNVMEQNVMEQHLVVLTLQLVGLLQLFGVLVLVVLALVVLDGRVDALLLDFGPRQVQVSVRLPVSVLGPFRLAEGLFIILLRPVQRVELLVERRLQASALLQRLRAQTK